MRNSEGYTWDLGADTRLLSVRIRKHSPDFDFD